MRCQRRHWPGPTHRRSEQSILPRKPLTCADKRARNTRMRACMRHACSAVEGPELANKPLHALSGAGLHCRVSEGPSTHTGQPDYTQPRLARADSVPAAAWPKPPPGLSLTQTAPWRAKDGSVGSSIMPDEPVHGKMGACDENGYAHSVGEDQPRKGGCEDGFDAGVTSSRRCFGSTRPPSRVVPVEILLATACIGVVREATRRSQQSHEGGLWQQRLGSVCASGMRVGGRPRVG